MKFYNFFATLTVSFYKGLGVFSWVIKVFNFTVDSKSHFPVRGIRKNVLGTHIAS